MRLSGESTAAKTLSRSKLLIIALACFGSRAREYRNDESKAVADGKAKTRRKRSSARFRPGMKQDEMLRSLRNLINLQESIVITAPRGK